jgi:bile acid-coenzyme A ligase
MAKVSYGAALGWLAAQERHRVAAVCGEQAITRGELERASNRLARAYQQLGVGAESRVTIALPNSLEFLVACMAAWKLGASPQPISARLPAKEREAIVALSAPALVVGVAAAEYPKFSSVPAGFAPDAALNDAPLPDLVPPHVRTMTSGGSTGRPKLIVDLTPALADPEVAENFMRPRGVALAPGPLYHAGPFIVAWQCILSGGTLVLMERFDAEQALALVERHRVDWVLFVPTMMQRIAKLAPDVRNKYDVSSLKNVMCSGAPSPPWLKRFWIEWLGPEKIFEAYGGTERIAGTVITGTEWLAHPGSVGKPPPGRMMRAQRPDGSVCASGEVGEIYMKPATGQGTTYRYIGATPTATRDGWETLGDIGWFDEDGYLYLADRKTDMILVGGSNVYPAEIEAAIDSHPRVRSSAVIGLPDDDLGGRLHAIVDAPEPVTETELRAHLAELLVAYKIPRSFEFVSEPLRDDAGKLRRSALREARLARAADPAER